MSGLRNVFIVGVGVDLEIALETANNMANKMLNNMANNMANDIYFLFFLVYTNMIKSEWNKNNYYTKTSIIRGLVLEFWT